MNTQQGLYADKPYSCGSCGERFATKAAKRSHKIVCAPKPALNNNEPQCEDQELYGRLAGQISPAIIARANAEWSAMDWRGRLPDGWKYEASQ